MPGILLNTTYDVRVRAKVGGVYSSYGPVCQVTTPPTLRTFNNDPGEESVATQTKVTPDVAIYPNPNQGEFIYVELKNLEPNSSVLVIDLSGKVVDQRILQTDSDSYSGTIRFSEKLKAGFYFVTILSGETKATEKLIVR